MDPRRHRFDLLMDTLVGEDEDGRELLLGFIEEDEPGEKVINGVKVTVEFNHDCEDPIYGEAVQSYFAYFKLEDLECVAEIEYDSWGGSDWQEAYIYPVEFKEVTVTKTVEVK